MQQQCNVCERRWEMMPRHLSSREEDRNISDLQGVEVDSVHPMMRSVLLPSEGGGFLLAPPLSQLARDVAAPEGDHQVESIEEEHNTRIKWKRN